MAKGKKQQSLVVLEEKHLKGSEGSMAKSGRTSGNEAGECEVAVDRRSGQDRRSGLDRRTRNEPVLLERRKAERRAKVPRRRQIDPTTCERDYTTEEIEFMRALDEYKRSSGRMFPTCSEILEVLRKLGYEKRVSEPSSSGPADGAFSAEALDSAKAPGASALEVPLKERYGG